MLKIETKIKKIFSLIEKIQDKLAKVENHNPLKLGRDLAYAYLKMKKIKTVKLELLDKILFYLTRYFQELKNNYFLEDNYFNLTDSDNKVNFLYFDEIEDESFFSFYLFSQINEEIDFLSLVNLAVVNKKGGVFYFNQEEKEPKPVYLTYEKNIPLGSAFVFIFENKSNNILCENNFLLPDKNEDNQFFIQRFFLEKFSYLDYSYLHNRINKNNLISKNFFIADEAKINFFPWILNNGGYLLSNIYLQGFNSQIFEGGVILANKKEDLFLNHNLFHQNKETKAEIIMRNVINEDAEININADISVNNESQNSKADLKIDNLLLEESNPEKIKISITPSLDLKTKQCLVNHGVTLANFNQEKLNYLLIKGFSIEQASIILIESHLSPAIDLLKNNDIKENLISLLVHKFNLK